MKIHLKSWVFTNFYLLSIVIELGGNKCINMVNLVCSASLAWSHCEIQIKYSSQSFFYYSASYTCGAHKAYISTLIRAQSDMDINIHCIFILVLKQFQWTFCQKQGRKGYNKMIQLCQHVPLLFLVISMFIWPYPVACIVISLFWSDFLVMR